MTFVFDREAYNKKVEWFRHDRFGMFIHWGIYAIPARGEWVRSVERIHKEDYEPFADEFDPIDYDLREWAKLAKAAGMKYAVLTAKHHDGYCLFDSKLTDYKSTNSPCKRDLVREFLDAFRAEGLKVGLYYSVIDWHHPDFPHYGDRNHPERDNEAFKGMEHNFDNYLKYMHGQIEELVTGYGKLDIMWFDFSYDDMTGEKWKATELVRMIRSHQPHLLMDNRLEVSGSGFGSLVTANPTEYCGDFVSPEQIIPPNGIYDELGNPVTWEACFTMNNNWGYHSTDRNFKPAPLLIHKLVECVSKGGNMILNVGPDGDGNIPSESVEILAQIGDWMAKNGESIRSCGPSSLEKPEFGRITRNADHLYFHIFENTLGALPLIGLKKEQVESLRLLASGKPIRVSTSWVHSDYPEILFADLGADPVLPDPVDTVLEVRLKG